MTTTERTGPARASELIVDIRPREIADDPKLVRIRVEARPWLPPMSVEEYRWAADPANSAPDDITERWVARVDGDIAGLYVITKLRVEREATFAGNIGVASDQRIRGVGSTLFAHLMQRAEHHGAARLYGQVSADDDSAISFLLNRGFAKTGRAQRMSRLVVADANLTGYEGLEEHLRAGGIVIQTLAEVGMADEAMMRRIADMNYAAARDIPTTEPWVKPPFDEFMKWLGSPGNAPDQSWVAFEGDRPVGWASVSTRGDDSSFNNLTGVLREYRGRGIARGLKLKTIEWARESGIHTIFTSNDYENKPMLSINIPLGYVEVPVELEVVRELGS
jgi:mycothiol synthase